MAMLTSVFLLMIVCLGNAHPVYEPEQCIQICKAYAKRSSQTHSQCLKYFCRQAILGYFNRFGKRTDTTFMRNDIPRFVISSQLSHHSQPKTTIDDMALQNWGTVGEGQVELDARLSERESDAPSHDKQLLSVSKQALVTASPFFLVVREGDDQRKSNLIPEVRSFW